jgi:hypothetical protein
MGALGMLEGADGNSLVFSYAGEVGVAGVSKTPS